MTDTLQAVINGIRYDITEDQQKIVYKGELYDILHNYEVGYYFILYTKEIYFVPTLTR